MTEYVFIAKGMQRQGGIRRREVLKRTKRSVLVRDPAPLGGSEATRWLRIDEVFGSFEEASAAAREYTERMIEHHANSLAKLRCAPWDRMAPDIHPGMAAHQFPATKDTRNV